MRSVRILGVRIDDVTYDECVKIVDRFVEEGGPHPVTTPNPEIVMLARRDLAFREVLDRAALAIPDGIGLLLAARLIGQPLRQHVRGTDLVHRLAERSVSRGWRWYLLGAAEGVASQAASALMQRYAGLQVVGASAGSPHPADDQDVRRAISTAGAIDLILVAYGAGLQERWMDRNLAALNIPVGLGVGGVFDFLAGRVSRAPRWVRDLELEFLYRLLNEPWRWRRQLALPHFALLALREGARRRIARRRERRV